MNERWTRGETLAALHVYLMLPFGKLHQRQPLVQQVAGWIGRSAGSVALKLVNFASLDPQIRASGRQGMANASRLDREIWNELQSDWDRVAAEAGIQFEKLASSHGTSPYVDVETELREQEEFGEGLTQARAVEVRVNQARFRKSILASYGSRCCISGIQEPKLLVASHICAWSDDKANRLNPANGLCLSALHDRAYDQGLITVLPNYVIQVAPSLLEGRDEFLRKSVCAFHGESIKLPERFVPRPEFLGMHARKFGFIV